MNELYPPESQQMGFVSHLEELRRRILAVLACYAVICSALFAFGNRILALLESPARGYLREFVFISPTEAFVAYFKVVLLASFVLCFPFALYELWAFLAPALSGRLQQAIYAWLCLAVACFVAGIWFTFKILLPAALHFLLTFGEGIATPVISLGEYVSFAVAFILIGGFVFEIPVIIGVLTEAGVLGSGRLRAGRRYAILANLVVAALITPTQDVVNLILFAMPMIVLYEVGIMLSIWVEKRRSADPVRS